MTTYNQTHAPAEINGAFERALRRALQEKVKFGGRLAYLNSMMRRNRQGKFLFPRTVASRLQEIEAVAPGAISEEEKQELLQLNNPQLQL